MRTIKPSTAFRRDYRRIRATPKHRDVDALLTSILDTLANDRSLPPHHRDHTLSGDWSGYRECHVRPDLLLIYDTPDDDRLRLVRLGSHSDLFGQGIEAWRGGGWSPRLADGGEAGFRQR